MIDIKKIIAIMVIMIFALSMVAIGVNATGGENGENGEQQKDMTQARIYITGMLVDELDISSDNGNQEQERQRERNRMVTDYQDIIDDYGYGNYNYQTQVSTTAFGENNDYNAEAYGENFRQKEVSLLVFQPEGLDSEDSDVPATKERAIEILKDMAERTQYKHDEYQVFTIDNDLTTVIAIKKSGFFNLFPRRDAYVYDTNGDIVDKKHNIWSFIFLMKKLGIENEALEKYNIETEDGEIIQSTVTTERNLQTIRETIQKVKQSGSIDLDELDNMKTYRFGSDIIVLEGTKVGNRVRTSYQIDVDDGSVVLEN